MNEVLAVMLLLISGLICIATGIFIVFGKGPALIAIGTCCLLAAFVTVRGLSRA